MSRVDPRIAARRRAIFLRLLAGSGNVTWAAHAAGYSRQHVYAVRANDPVFAQAWDAARDQAAEELEAEAWRRAVEGIEEPICAGGKVVGTWRRYSDALLMLLLHGAMPKKYPKSHA